MAKKDKKNADHERESIGEGVSKKFKQSPALYIGSVAILILVVVTFVGGDLLSGGGFGGNRGDLTFGYYDKVPISWVPGNMFSQYVDRVVQYYRSQGLDANDFRFESQVWRQAYDATVVHTAILRIMNKSKYVVPGRTVDRNVAKLPHFQDNGRFSQALYRQMSDSQRSSLWKQTQDDMKKMAFYNDTFGTLITSSESDFIAEMASTTRSFDVVSFKVDDYPLSEYISFARENAKLFNSIHLSVISINSEKEAQRILASIKDGTMLFEDAARAQSQDMYADRGGDMGSRSFHELEQDIPGEADREAVFSLEKGALSGIISNGSQWSFYRIEEEKAEADFDDEAVMEKVRTYVGSFRRGLMEDWAFNQAKTFIEEAKQTDFAAAARARLLDKQSFGPLPINYGGVDLFTTLESFTIPGLTSQDLGSIARNEDFWKTAYSAEINTPSDPLVQGNNVLVFLPTAEEKADESSVENISSMYSSYWVNGNTEQSLNTYFLNSDKMEDNFWDVYFRVFNP